jgi:hypothetical protein
VSESRSECLQSINLQPCHVCACVWDDSSGGLMMMLLSLLISRSH